MNKSLKIGTRKSQLALIQTEIVRRKINTVFPDISIEIQEISTRGDRELNRSLASFGGKGVFTRELETALLSGEIDLAVHSAKDLPLTFPNGLGICAVMEPEDPRDVIVTCHGIPLKNLPSGSILGTSSLRRQLQAQKINSGIEVRMLRGNVHTRLQKLKSGEYDAIVMAAAGLKRSGLANETGIFYEYFDPMEFLPAVGQGILAVEGRIGDLTEIMEAINDREAELILETQRGMLQAIGSGCNAPAAAYTRIEQDHVIMRAMYAKDTEHLKYIDMTGKAGPEFGKKVGEQLCQRDNTDRSF